MNKEAHAYFIALEAAQREKLRYLLPLDGWFAMIIYLSLKAKDHAQWATESGIADEIRRIKSNPRDHGNLVEGLTNPTRGNWPIEVDLDSCAHF